MKRTEFIPFHSGVYDKAPNKLPQLEKCLINIVSKIKQGVRHQFRVLTITYLGVDMAGRIFMWQTLTWVSLFLGVFIGFYFNLNFINVLYCATGWLLFLAGMYIHYLSHKVHPKAHEDISTIDYIATKGVYSWIRHPGYLGLALAFLGIAIAFGSIPALIVATSLTISHYLQAVKEERLMLRKFGNIYVKYMEEVPDRFIPIRKIIRILRK